MATLPLESPSQSFWLEELPQQLRELRFAKTRDQLPAHADVVIVGGGMSGVSVAYHLLKQSNYRDRKEYEVEDSKTVPILLLEARGLCGGATGRNGGFLHEKGWDQWWPLFRRYGARTATDLCRFEIAGRRAIHSVLSGRHDIDCEIDLDVKVGNLFLESASDGGLREKLGIFYPLRSLLRLFGISVLETPAQLSSVFNLKTTHGLGSAIMLDSGCDTFWPAKFVLGVVKELVKKSEFHVMTRTPVLKVDRNSQRDGRILITTSEGTMTCDKIVYATNAWSSYLLPDLKNCIRPVLNTVVSSQPNGGHGLLKDGHKLRRTGLGLYPGYHYWHERRDGRVILGGFRDMVADKGVGVSEDGEPDPDVVRAAVTFLSEEVGFDVNFSCDYSWTGIIGWSMDGLPLVGPISHMILETEAGYHASEYLCAGFSGHGMTQCWLAGAAVAEMVRGHNPSAKFPFVSAFLPTRTRLGMSNLQKSEGDWFQYENDKEKE